MSVSVFGDGPKGLTAFAEAPAGEFDNLRLLDHVGKAAVFTVKGPEQTQLQTGEVKPTVRTDVVVIESDGSSQSYSDVLIFNKAVVQQLSSSTGDRVVAAIDSYKGFGGKGAEAPKLVAPSAEQVAAAEKATA